MDSAATLDHGLHLLKTRSMQVFGKMLVLIDTEEDKKRATAQRGKAFWLAAKCKSCSGGGCGYCGYVGQLQGDPI